MKTKFLHFAIFFFALVVAFRSHSQVTIDQSNFLRGTTYIDTLVQAMPSSLGAPGEGPDQVWDYTGLMEGDTYYTDHFGVSNHPEFPDATTYYRSDLTFQGFPIQNHYYETVDDQGWAIVGQEITDVTFSITAITGGPTDSLRFVGGNYPYPVYSELINFPATYQDQWTSETIGNTPFELTVAAFGLNKVPGNRKRSVTNDREIAGYGKLMIPTLDGTPSAPMDVLLMKTTSITIDSVFLGGAPAPPPLMAAFGLVQGSIDTSTYYFCYKPGFGSAVLFYSPQSGAFSYRPTAAEIVSGVKEADLMEVEHFPNPVAAGKALTIELENPLSSGMIRFIDLQGRVEHETAIDSAFGNQLFVKVPASMREGLYIFQVQDLTRGTTGVGKLQVE